MRRQEDQILPRRLPTVLRAALGAVCALVLLTVTAAPAAAAPTASETRSGVDVSWPQCGTVLPTGMAYAIVGVNGGTAATTNRCLVEQLSWAFETTTGINPNQPRVQLYVNTANPGELLEEYSVSTWPTFNVDPRGGDSYQNFDESRRNPYGRCSPTPENYRGYTNDLACSWQYGWNRAVEAVDQRFAPAARLAAVSDVAADYTWWLDVETMNSWQDREAGAYARNTASLEGMKQFLDAEGATVGLYSTAYQWRLIVGDTLDLTYAYSPTVGRNLLGAPSWLAGASNATAAEFRCFTLSGLTGGPVVLNQYIYEDLDYNYSCV